MRDSNRGYKVFFIYRCIYLIPTLINRRKKKIYDKIGKLGNYYLKIKNKYGNKLDYGSPLNKKCSYIQQISDNIFNGWFKISEESRKTLRQFGEGYFICNPPLLYRDVSAILEATGFDIYDAFNDDRIVEKWDITQMDTFCKLYGYISDNRPRTSGAPKDDCKISKLSTALDLLEIIYKTKRKLKETKEWSQPLLLDMRREQKLLMRLDKLLIKKYNSKSKSIESTDFEIGGILNKSVLRNVIGSVYYDYDIDMDEYADQL